MHAMLSIPIWQRKQTLNLRQLKVSNPPKRFSGDFFYGIKPSITKQTKYRTFHGFHFDYIINMIRPKVYIRAKNSYYQISFIYNQSVVDVIRSFPQRRYLAELKIWEIPENTQSKKCIQTKLSSVADIEFVKQEDSSQAIVSKIPEVLSDFLIRKRESIGG